MNISNRKENALLKITIPQLFALLFLAGRILLFLTLIPDNLHGFGDFQVYFDSAAIPGLPYFQYWSEYPPLFAWMVELLFIISTGNQFLFDFLLYFLLSIAGSVSIWLVAEISTLMGFDSKQIDLRSSVFFAVLAFSSYTWWYFDLIPVALMLAAIYSLLKNKETLTGIWLGLGILAKWFPILLLPAIFRFRTFKSFLKMAAIAILMTIFVWGIHFVLSSQMTWASLQSQPSRSSWQTIWALIDDNLTTGAFVPMEERIWPEAAIFPRGNEAVIPGWITLIIFGGLGLFLLLRTQKGDPKSLIATIGLTWILFLIWSPGWSPQWVLYLVPLLLITLPFETALKYVFALLLLTSMEWPFLLSRRFFIGLWIIVPIRMLLMIGMLVQWVRLTRPHSVVVTREK